MQNKGVGMATWQVWEEGLHEELFSQHALAVEGELINAGNTSKWQDGKRRHLEHSS